MHKNLQASRGNILTISQELFLGKVTFTDLCIWNWDPRRQKRINISDIVLHINQDMF